MQKQTYAYVPFKRGASLFMVSVDGFLLFLPVANPEASSLLMRKQRLINIFFFHYIKSTSPVCERNKFFRDLVCNIGFYFVHVFLSNGTCE